MAERTTTRSVFFRKLIDLVARAVQPGQQTDVEALEGGAMAVGAVDCEPVSQVKFPANSELTANSFDFHAYSNEAGRVSRSYVGHTFQLDRGHRSNLIAAR
jgi:hypothetical protein